MIPLRVLQACALPSGPDAEAARATATVLAQVGHTTTCLMPRSGHPGIDLTTAFWPWILGERRRTVRSVAAWMPDLLHVHGLVGLGPLLEIARRLGLGVVCSLTQTEDPYAARRLRDPRVSWVVVPTEHLRAHAQARIGIPRDRLAIVPPLVPAVHRSASTGPWRLGVLALPGARLQACLQGLAHLQASGLEVAVRVHDRWCSSAVPLPPGATQADGTLADLLTGIDALVVAGRRDAPPAVLLAALAAGVPVVVRSLPGVPELVEDGRTGLVVAADTAEAWAAALRSLQDHGLRATMAAAAQETANERFAAADSAEALTALYRATLGQGSVSAKAEVSQTWRRLSELRGK